MNNKKLMNKKELLEWINKELILCRNHQRKYSDYLEGEVNGWNSALEEIKKIYL